MSPLPLPSGVAYGEEAADELEMVEEEAGSAAQPLPMIVIRLQFDCITIKFICIAIVIVL